MVKESDCKSKFCKKLKNLKCTVLQYKQDATTLAGFPDTIVLLPEGLTVFIEFKKSKNAKFRPGQKEWGVQLKERGYFWWACYPENADEVLKEIKDLI
jgi:hypothetical protein